MAFLAITTYSFRVLPHNSVVSARRLFPKADTPTVVRRDNKQFFDPQNPIMASDRPSVLHPPVELITDGKGGAGEGELIVSDILNKERDVNAFASLTRQVESISTRLDNGSKNTTVLAPSNVAVQRLPRKPWESPDDYEVHGQDEAYAGEQGRDRAARNIKRFVEMHVVPESPWAEGTEVETLGGAKVFWKKGEDGKIYVSIRWAVLVQKS